MRLREHATTIGILVALAGVSGYLVATRHQASEGEREGRKANVLQVFRRDDLTAIVVERDGAGFTLSRKPGGADAGMDRLWSIEQGGRRDLADQFGVDRALTALEFASFERTIKPGEVDRAAFGLERPRLSMSFSMGKLTSKLAVGGPAVKPEGAVYVEVDGRVFVVKQGALSAVDLPVDAFRTRTLAPYLSTNSKAIGLAPPGGAAFSMSRGPGTTWRLDDGVFAGLRVDRLAFDRVLAALADLKAERFVGEAEATAAQKGAQVVVLTLVPSEEGKAKGELAIGGACPANADEVVVVRRSPEPVAACAARGVYEALARSADALVDRRAFSARDDEIEQLTLEQGDKRVELARKGKGWHQRQPVDAEVSLEAARHLVRALATARGAEAPSRAGGAFEAVARVTVKPVHDDGVERPDEVVEVGREGRDGATPIKRLQDGAVVVLGRDEARSFLPRASALRSPKLIDEALDRVRRIEVASAEVRQTLERGADGAWSLVEPKGLPVDIGVASELAEVLVHLTVDRWAADADDGSFGLAKPSLTASLQVTPTDVGGAGAAGTAGAGGSGGSGAAPGAGFYRVELGESGPSGVFGRLVGAPGVFVVPRSLERQLAQWAIDRTLFVVDSAEVEAITLTRPGVPALSLVGRGERYEVAAGGPELSGSRLDALREALQELRAEAAVHPGAARKDEGFDRPTLEVKVKRIAGRGERSRDVRFVIGASDAYRSSSVFYARRDGIDATFALPAARVRALLSPF